MSWKKKGSTNVPSVDIKKDMMDGRPVAMIWPGWPVRQCLNFISLASKLGGLFGRGRLQVASFYHCETRTRRLAPSFGSTDEIGTSRILSQNGSQKAHTLNKLPGRWLQNKLFQFTKICKSPRLTVMFSGIKICVLSSMPIRPYP
jgi:hypothetical protein